MERERRFFRGAARDSRDGDKRARRFFGGARGGGCTCLGANIIVKCLAGKLSGRGEPWCTQNRPQLRSPDEIYTNVGRGGRGGGWKGVSAAGRTTIFFVRERPSDCELYFKFA